LTAPRNPGHLASREWSCRDAGQHGANPGHPGKSGTGGNPNWWWLIVTYLLSCTVSKLWLIICQFSLATGGHFTLTPSLGVIPCKYPDKL